MKFKACIPLNSIYTFIPLQICEPFRIWLILEIFRLVLYQIRSFFSFSIRLFNYKFNFSNYRILSTVPIAISWLQRKLSAFISFVISKSSKISVNSPDISLFSIFVLFLPFLIFWKFCYSLKCQENLRKFFTFEKF